MEFTRIDHIEGLRYLDFGVSRLIKSQLSR